MQFFKGLVPAFDFLLSLQMHGPAVNLFVPLSYTMDILAFSFSLKGVITSARALLRSLSRVGNSESRLTGWRRDAFNRL